jgi:hypothetical protein
MYRAIAGDVTSTIKKERGREKLYRPATATKPNRAAKTGADRSFS